MGQAQLPDALRERVQGSPCDGRIEQVRARLRGHIGADRTCSGTDRIVIAKLLASLWRQCCDYLAAAKLPAATVRDRCGYDLLQLPE